MDMLKYEFFRYFKNNEDELVKIRALKDNKSVYYKAMFIKEIESEFDKLEMKEGLEKGYLAYAKISIDGTHRNVVAWMDQELLPPGIRGKIILIFRRFKKWIKSLC